MKTFLFMLPVTFAVAGCEIKLNTGDTGSDDFDVNGDADADADSDADADADADSDSDSDADADADPDPGMSRAPGCGYTGVACYAFTGAAYAGQEEAVCTEISAEFEEPLEYFASGCPSGAYGGCEFDDPAYPDQEYMFYYYDGLPNGESDCGDSGGSWTSL